MKTSSAILGLTLVGAAGLGAFFVTRSAAAKSKASAAITVDPQCFIFVVVDEEKAKSAIVAAAIAVNPSMDSSAIEALKAIFAKMFPACDWTNPPAQRIFVRRSTGQNLSWANIEALIGDKTVGEVKDLAKSAGLTGGVSAGEPMPWPILWGFGTGCSACTMGTGGRRRDTSRVSGAMRRRMAG
jgi:hypothetical protein